MASNITSSGVMTLVEQDTLFAPPPNRSAYRNLFIYTSHNRGTVLGGLWVAEGITNTNLYSMVEILCDFTEAFDLQDDSQRLIQRDKQLLKPGNYYIATTGRFPPCFGGRLPLTRYRFCYGYQ